MNPKEQLEELARHIGECAHDGAAYGPDLRDWHERLSAILATLPEPGVVSDYSAAVVELIEAIKPLAALDLRPDGFDKRDDSQPVYARDNSVITVGDVRRAAAALAQQGGSDNDR